MLRRRWVGLVVLMIFALALPAGAAKKKEKAEEERLVNSSVLSGLQFREIGPAITSGRVSDLAVVPGDDDSWYVAVASGGVWKTTNHGTTFSPIFDGEGSYSIGCVAVDPKRTSTVWVGTGENNSQRSVSYGDGLYKSLDGGKSWNHVGLKESEHIGKILIDPRDTDVVYVAAQGPLWNAGGDRGLYKTIDGGTTWEKVLEISDDTGVTDIAFHPSDPDTIYAAAYQRRRRVWTLIDGGPESSIYKSTDAGATWREIKSGLPSSDLGRIGLAVTPAQPDLVYAIVEAERGDSGFYRSTDAGESWVKRSGYVAGSPQYYQEIVADPHDADRVYSLDTWMQVSYDGGASFQDVGEAAKHVDNHSLWIDPADTDHLIAGCDGGIYETYDRGATWRYQANLPVTQFYRIQPDNDFPFYNVYGGTQDNFTLGGPSRTTSANGITNQDWFITLGGDGFEPQIDPSDPNIVYSQYQYGGLARFDRASGEAIDIQPQPAATDEPLRWNWDSPLIISPHSNSRLYFAAQRIFRSDDRGNGWEPISGDLTRAIDHNTLETMGRIQKVDAVAKNASTSQYGNLVALSESPLEEGLLYAGSDDGLVQVFESGEWRKIDSFPNVPRLSYVSDLETSRHDANRVYAAFDDHKSGNYTPYLLRSDDRGKSWSSIVGDLPDDETIYTFAEDHADPDLLFVGTEYGVYVTVDGGQHWVRLKGGLPTIAVRDLEIQRRENDLVVGTFGRGIWILDDYTPLRKINEQSLAAGPTIFPIKPAWMFIESAPLGLRGKSFQGDAFFTLANPAVSATVTYYLDEELTSKKAQRKKAEQQWEEEKEPYQYPSFDALKAEEREEDPSITITIQSEAGQVVRRITGPTGKGVHRVQWDLRYPSFEPTSLQPRTLDNPFSDPVWGPLAAPGRYTATLSRRVDGKSEQLAGPIAFETVPLGTATLEAKDKQALLAFQLKVGRLQRAVLGSGRSLRELGERIEYLTKAQEETLAADESHATTARELNRRHQELSETLFGDRTRAGRNAPTLPSIGRRVGRIVGSQWTSSSAPTTTNREAYRIAGDLFGDALRQLKALASDVRAFEAEMERAGAPWTPGRLPSWEME